MSTSPRPRRQLVQNSTVLSTSVQLLPDLRNTKKFLYFLHPSPLNSGRMPPLDSSKAGNRDVSPRPRTMLKTVSVHKYRQVEKDTRDLSPGPRKRVFRAVWTKLDYLEGRPEVREGAGMAECCNVLYLYGGLGTTVLNDVYSLRSLSSQWTPALPKGLELEARYGHSMQELSTKLVIFGGSTTSTRKSQLRECLNTVRFLEPGSNGAIEASFLANKGNAIDMRRYHSATIVGKHMVVIGGLSQRNKVLDDCSILDTETGKWVSCNLMKDSAAVACHAAACVFEPFLKLTGVFDPALGQDSPKLKMRGLYLFGGVDNKGIPNNQVRVIQPVKKFLVCTIVTPGGHSPEPRYQHTMNFSKHTNSLIIFGGKTGLPGEACRVLRDLHILDLESFCWSEVSIAGEVPEARCAHSAGTWQDKIVLFGGINLTTFCSSETYWLDVAAHLINPERNRFAQQLASTVRRIPVGASRSVSPFRNPMGKLQEILLNSTHTKRD